MHTVKFSPDRLYRYRLEADLGEGEGTCLFVMLNPSTADEVASDPTITRCKDFAKSWGYRTLMVCNLFAFRATNPAVLRQTLYPVGEANDRAILSAVWDADCIIAAWGTHGGLRERDREVKKILRVKPVYHLGLTREGHPRHPLYLAKKTKRTLWDL